MLNELNDTCMLSETTSIRYMSYTYPKWYVQQPTGAHYTTILLPQNIDCEAFLLIQHAHDRAICGVGERMKGLLKQVLNSG